MRLAGTRDEIPFWVESEGYSLFGVLTTPTVPANGVVVILATGGSRAPSFGRNRIWVDAARRWAGLGFHTARFAFRTTGESTGGSARYLLGDPWDADILAVTEYALAQAGVDRVVLAGICFGARSQLKAASKISELAGLVAIPVPVRDFGLGESMASYPLSWYVKQLKRPGSWKRLLEKRQRAGIARIVRKRLSRISRRFRPSGSQPNVALTPPGSGVSERFVTYLRAVSARGIPVLLAFGRNDKFWEDFQKAEAQYPDLTAPDNVEVDVVDDMYLHGMRTVEAQQWIINRFEEFLVETVVGGDQIKEQP